MKISRNQKAPVRKGVQKLVCFRWRFKLTHPAVGLAQPQSSGPQRLAAWCRSSLHSAAGQHACGRPKTWQSTNEKLSRGTFENLEIWKSESISKTSQHSVRVSVGDSSLQILYMSRSWVQDHYHRSLLCTKCTRGCDLKLNSWTDYSTFFLLSYDIMQYFNVIKSISIYWDVRYASIPNQQQIHIIRTVDTGFEETKTYWTLDSHLWGGQDLCHVLIFRMTLPLEFLLPRSWNHSPLKPDTWKISRKSCPFLGISQHFLQKCLITKKPRCDAFPTPRLQGILQFFRKASRLAWYTFPHLVFCGVFWDPNGCRWL